MHQKYAWTSAFETVVISEIPAQNRIAMPVVDILGSDFGLRDTSNEHGKEHGSESERLCTHIVH